MTAFRQTDNVGGSTHETNGHEADESFARSNAYAVDWDQRARDCAEDLTAPDRAHLARALSLPESALAALDVGYLDRGPHGGQPCWTFPELDGAGQVVGISCRYEDGRKISWGGGRRGLIIPVGWQHGDGPLFLPEGPSDTLALTAMRLSAIGRPSNHVGTECIGHLAKLLKDVPADRRLIIVAEFDPKQDGKWPGREGAEQTAANLAAALNRSVYWALPPDKAKDSRAWVLSNRPPDDLADDWEELGGRFTKAIESCCREVRPLRTQGSYRFQPVDSATFAEIDYRPEWLVNGVLTRRQPAIVGGPRKGMKTSLLIDLAVSLGSGTPFLGRFPAQRCRVALISGESGGFTLQETARRVCAARGLDVADLEVAWDFTLPHLSNPEHVRELADGLRRLEVAVLVLDPLYLALTAGAAAFGPRPENVFDMGPLLLSIGRACLDAGATPVLAHHSRKHQAYGQAMELDDLAFAGAAEWARQWMLIARQEKYEHGTGIHRLWLNVGGSAGHGALHSVTIHEGVMDDDFRGRTWEVEVSAPSAARQAKTDERARKRDEERRQRDDQDEHVAAGAIDAVAAKSSGGVAGYTRARAMSRLSGTRFEAAVNRLLQAGTFIEAQITTIKGHGAKATTKGLARAKESDE